MSLSVGLNKVTVEYPVLRKAANTGLIILFTDKHTGVVLLGDEHWDFGTNYDEWNHSEDSDWVKVEGTIRG